MKCTKTVTPTVWQYDDEEENQNVIRIAHKLYFPTSSFGSHNIGNFVFAFAF